MSDSEIKYKALKEQAHQNLKDSHEDNTNDIMLGRLALAGCVITGAIFIGVVIYTLIARFGFDALGVPATTDPAEQSKYVYLWVGLALFFLAWLFLVAVIVYMYFFCILDRADQVEEAKRETKKVFEEFSPYVKAL